jgi:tRNA threonylcarbamoyladenosine biosynthesis protein TsaB
VDKYIIHLETATKVCSVALSKNGSLLSVKETQDERYSHGEKLNVLIHDVLEQTKIKIKDLSAVSVTSGPGSYTGLRIGAATAKSLCYSLAIPLIAIDALISLSEIALLKHKNTNLCPLIDARRMEVYNTILDENLIRQKEITADIIDETSYEEHLPFVYFGDGAQKLKAIWEGRDCVLDSTIKSSATGQVRLAFSKFQNNTFEDVAYWEPFYLKDFIAGKKIK